MNTTSLKADVLQLLSIARQQELAFIENLSETERNAIGTQEEWSAKDMIANIAAWKRMQTEKLVTAIRGETPPVWKDMALVNQINADIFTKYHDYSWQQVMQTSEQAYNDLVAQVERMSEAELTDSQRYEWQDGEPLYGETLGNGLWYPYTYLTQFYQRQGEIERAFHMYEMVIQVMREMGMPPHMLGGALYNLACTYATNGQPDKAIGALSEALRLRPSLVEWSKQDTDLESLHSSSTFSALYKAIGESIQSSNLIAPNELYKQLGREEKPLVIDVRGPKEYEAGHVQGAINITLGQLPKKLAKISRGQSVITYCNMHHRGESRGERAATLLSEQGYEVRTLDGGFPEWEAQGLPVEKTVRK